MEIELLLLLMSLEPTEELVNQLLNAMEQAAQRGAEVSLLVDGCISSRFRITSVWAIICSIYHFNFTHRRRH